MSYAFTRQKIVADKKARVRKMQRMGLAVTSGMAVLALIYWAFGLHAVIGVTVFGGAIGVINHIVFD